VHFFAWAHEQEDCVMPGGWSLEQVAQEIRRNANKRTPVRTMLLTGAGCSFQAGIPLARGFVDEISARFPDEYGRAVEKTYPICMGELSASDRHDLISEYIDKAKINWAHISIAQLMRAGYVDRVLTTNFDPLVRRACGLLNSYPAVYDMAVVRKGFVADYVRDQAVFHLHGQRDGFVQLHRKEEVDALAEAIEPLFDDTARNRCWIVIGYSGANDPVFRALANRPEFPNRLFWVGFRDEQPSADVKAALLDAGKDVHWISGYDPDTFLLQLASRLGCFPPGFFAKPFSHLSECFGLLAGFRLPGQDQDLDWAARARGWIEQAIATFEAMPAAVAASAAPPAPAAAPPSPGAAAIELESVRAPAAQEPEAAPTAAAAAPARAEGDVVGQAWVAMMVGDYDKIIGLRPRWDAGEIPELAELLSWAYVRSAQLLIGQAKSGAEDQRAKLLQEAEQQARQAEDVQPGVGAPDLARIAALTGREDDCRKWLGTAKEHGRLPTRIRLETDDDLASVRNAPWFQELLGSLSS
jgi:hypothetical protein